MKHHHPCVCAFNKNAENLQKNFVANLPSNLEVLNSCPCDLSFLDKEKSSNNFINFTDQSSINQNKNIEPNRENSLAINGDNYFEIVNYMRLIRATNIGPSLFWRLIEIFGDVSTAVEEAVDFFKSINSKKKIKLATISEVEDEIEKTQKFGAEIIIASDPRYPQILKTIYDSPPLLTVKGDLSFFNKPAVAIVGARNCSFSASNIAKKIAVEFGQNSIITISGLARGIDCAVHEASILSGTIAVIAGGIDSIYPQENKRLYQQISQYGLLVTEMPFGSPPKSNYFIKRNRIISGLAPSLIVVEASLKSGSLATSRFALEQGREIYACAGSPFDPRSAGVNKLVKDGARIITDLDELISEVAQNNRNMLTQNSENLSMNFLNSQSPKIVNSIKQITPDIQDRNIQDQNIQDQNEQVKKNIPIAKSSQFNQIEDKELQQIIEIIISKINNQAISIDEIIEYVQKPAKLINVALMHLELNGQISINHGRVSGDNLLI
jgi:DNA processing protein